MKKTKLITFAQIKRWTLLGLFLFFFGGGFIFVPDFSFSSIGGEIPSDRSNMNFQNLTSVSLFSAKEGKDLYKHLIENKCHVDAKNYDTEKPFKDVYKNYKEKQNKAVISAAKGRHNSSRGKVNPPYKRLGAKNNVSEKIPEEKGKDSNEKQLARQKKTPSDNPEKDMCGQRGENPTAASEKNSSCKLAMTMINNLCAFKTYMNFKMVDGAAREKDICESYPKKCQNGEYIGGAVWFNQYGEKQKSKFARILRKEEHLFNETQKQFREHESDDRTAQQNKAREMAMELHKSKRKDIATAMNTMHKKETLASPQADRYARPAIQALDQVLSS